MNPALLFVTLGLGLFAGMLVAIEAAISAFSQARAAELVDDGREGAVALAKVLADPAPPLSTVLLLRVLSETSAVVAATLLSIGAFGRGHWVIVLTVLAITLASYVVLRIGPRTLGRQHSERIALLSAVPVAFLTRLLGPVLKMLILVGNALTPGKGFREGPFASEVEVREMVDLAAQSAVIESDESRMIQSVFDLGDTLVREVMVPRTDLVCIEHTKTLRQAMSLALRSGYSRIPVIGENLDDVVSMAYLKDVTKRVFDSRAAETSEKIGSIGRECMFVPDTKHADDLLREMQARRTHVAIVVDEYGGTAGMVTIEDILEEIVGEIDDEYDTGPAEREQLSGGAWRVSARLDVDDLEELFDVTIYDDEDVDTVAGLMAKRLGKVPLPGSVVEIEGLRLEALAPTGRRNRIARIDITRIGRGDR